MTLFLLYLSAFFLWGWLEERKNFFFLRAPGYRFGKGETVKVPVEFMPRFHEVTCTSYPGSWMLYLRFTDPQKNVANVEVDPEYFRRIGFNLRKIEDHIQKRILGKFPAKG